MKNLKIQLLISGIAAGLVAVAFTFSSHSIQGAQRKTPPKKPLPITQISSVAAALGNHQAMVTGYGYVSASRSLSLTAEVSGRVVNMSPKLLSGMQFKAGEELLRIDDVSYQQAYASAKSDLASAEVELLQQRLNQKQAQDEWKRSGLSGKPDSELVLYVPQVKAAKAKVEDAQRQKAKTLSDLKKTQIKAPFNAQIITRAIEQGSYLQAGSEILQMFDTDRVEIAIPLSTQQWANLPPIESMVNTTRVKLVSTDGLQSWEGQVNRAEHHVNTSSHQRALIITLDNPLDLPQPLYPGTFVRAEIPGQWIRDIWEIPASAITQDNQIWYITEQGTLEQATAHTLFSINEVTYIKPIAHLKQAQIAAMPLSSYLPGMRVKTKRVSSNNLVDAKNKTEANLDSINQKANTLKTPIQLSQTERVKVEVTGMKVAKKDTKPQTERQP